MPPFRRVEGERAGPNALGILVPPGRRTVVIVRPRALAWDLVPLGPSPENGAGPVFWEIGREQAQAVAQRLCESLEEWTPGLSGRVEALPSPAGDGYQVRAALGQCVLIVCPRTPGQPYQPQVFPSVDEAKNAAERIAVFLCPAANADQELYFNTRNFTR